MSTYLFGINTCIYYLKGLFDLNRIFEQVGISNCAANDLAVAHYNQISGADKAPVLYDLTLMSNTLSTATFEVTSIIAALLRLARGEFL